MSHNSEPLPLVDVSRLQTMLSDFEGDTDTIWQLWNTFETDSACQCTAIAAMAEQSDADQKDWTRAIHTIKSTAALFGAEALRSAAEQAERASREGDVSQEERQTIARRLGNLLDDTLPALRSMIEAATGQSS